MQNIRNTQHRPNGFTLIEIVLVLVLIGILAAVAVPKYFDLSKNADEMTARSIGAEMQARVNGEFAKFLLEGNACKAFPAAPENAMKLGDSMTEEINQTNINVRLSGIATDDGGVATFLIKVNSTPVYFEIHYPSCAVSPNPFQPQSE